MAKLSKYAKIDSLAAETFSVTPDQAETREFAIRIIKHCLGIYDAIENGNIIAGTDNFPDAVVNVFGLSRNRV